MKRFIEWFSGEGAAYVMIGVLIVVVAVIISLMLAPTDAFLGF
jgi:hypothetical protein